MLGSMATAAFAAPAGSYAQPGASVSADHTVCSGAGAFGWFGAYGEVDNIHDVNRTDGVDLGYDEYADNKDDNVGQGAEGGVTGGTGDRNSSSCGNPQHIFQNKFYSEK